MARKLFSLFDEYQSKENSNHTSRAMRENTRRSFYNGSAAPFAANSLHFAISAGDSQRVDPTFGDTNAGTADDSTLFLFHDLRLRRRFSKKWFAASRPQGILQAIWYRIKRAVRYLRSADF